jgi:hypothetical protein
MGSLVPLVKDLGTGTAQTVKGFKDLLDVLSIITEWKNKLLGDKPEEQNIFSKGLRLLVSLYCHRASSIWQVGLKI